MTTQQRKQFAVEIEGVEFVLQAVRYAEVYPFGPGPVRIFQDTLLLGLVRPLLDEVESGNLIMNNNGLARHLFDIIVGMSPGWRYE